MNIRRPLAATAIALLALTSLTACDPRAGQSCDPSKDSSFYSTHTDNGKTVTVSLECRQVGINRYEWVKV